MNFGKVLRGGVIFNPRIFVADLGNFKQGFLIMKLIQIVISGFRVCFFNNCIEKNQNKTHFEEGMCMHFILSGPHASLHICNHIHYKKKLQHNFPKMRGKKFISFGSGTLPLPVAYEPNSPMLWQNVKNAVKGVLAISLPTLRIRIMEFCSTEIPKSASK